MKIGFIDCDKKNDKNPFPNIALMKLSAWHKKQGDSVEWYDLINATIHFMTTGKNMYDKVYVSKVFSFSDDYENIIYSDLVEYGGSGFAIELIDGKEVYTKEKDKPLPDEIEHIYPDYDLYGIEDTAYGFITRGCPRGCEFCHVKAMQSLVSKKVANLEEFWSGQKNIVLLDPNITACRDWKDVFQQLIDSKANVDFSQGLDIRMMTEEKAHMLNQIKTKTLHFAWDRYEDKNIIVPKLEMFRSISKIRAKDLIVYVLCGDVEREVRPEDLERIYTLREIGFSPYVMIYDKDSLPKGNNIRKLQRWVNNRFIWSKVNTFEDYLRGNKNELLE